MPGVPNRLHKKLIARKENGSFRSLPRTNDLVDFSSNDYLGFSGDSSIYELASKLLSENEPVKNGATGSRLLSGNHPLHGKFENQLANVFEAESALVFNSGYDANIGFFSSVPQRGDLVFYDELIHASIRDGIKMGNAKGYKFAHNNLQDLEAKIEMAVRVQLITNDVTVYIVTESIFSMDGDSPDLSALAKLCTDNNYRLIVDEAHAIGIFGKDRIGLVPHLKLEKEVFSRTVTFGKSLGCHGAVILGNSDLIDYLINFARSFIYTTALPPHSVATGMVSLGQLVSEHGRQRTKELHKNITYFKETVVAVGLSSNFLPSDSAIHSCLIGSNKKTKMVSDQLLANGFDIKPILSPTVPKGKERLRFCIHSFNSENEISEVLKLLVNFT